MRIWICGHLTMYVLRSACLLALLLYKLHNHAFTLKASGLISWMCCTNGVNCIYYIIASTKETLLNLVLGVLCACGLPVHAIAEEIEISGLSVCRFQICAILKRHNNIQHAQVTHKHGYVGFHRTDSNQREKEIHASGRGYKGNDLG